MQLYSLLIEGYRKHLKTKIIFSDSTFLIGENNVGKSSVLYALDYLLGASSTIPLDEFYALEDGGERIIAVDKVVLTAEFRNIPKDASSWRGFKGRLLRYESEEKDSLDTGLKFIYTWIREIGCFMKPILNLIGLLLINCPSKTVF